MIEVENLTKSFGKIRALDHLSFQLGEGEILGLLGPNGAGKTTAMRIMTGFLAPDEGAVRLDGIDILKESKKARSLLGYVPENANLYGDMTVQSFLDFVAGVKGIARRERNKAVEETLELCRIWDVRHRMIGKLSRGYRQRVSLAQALHGRPKILILDEPTTGLDPKQINEIRELVKNLKGRQTIILSTHILPEVSLVSDRVLIINEGKLVAAGTPEELGSQFRSTQEILVTVRGDVKITKPVLHRLKGVLSVEKVDTVAPDEEVYKILCDKAADLRGHVARVLIDSGFELLELRSQALSLEDIFLKLVTKEDEDLAAGEEHESPEAASVPSAGER